MSEAKRNNQKKNINVNKINNHNFNMPIHGRNCGGQWKIYNLTHF